MPVPAPKMDETEMVSMGMTLRNQTLLWEILGSVFIILVGSSLHFIFELAGRSVLVAPFSAVNESTWEHLKLTFWPALVWIIAEYKFIRKTTKNFVAAKTAGIYAMPTAITILFYAYKVLLGTDLFMLDIAIFMLAVVMGQAISYKLLTSSQKPKFWDRFALISLLVLLVCFLLFSFFPPQIFLFQDPISGGYGIL